MSDEWKGALVEKMAREIYVESLIGLADHDDCLRAAKHCLAVALPEILERAATVTERHIGEWHSDLPTTAFIPTGIAAKIRNLKDETC